MYSSHTQSTRKHGMHTHAPSCTRSAPACRHPSPAPAGITHAVTGCCLQPLQPPNTITTCQQPLLHPSAEHMHCDRHTRAHTAPRVGLRHAGIPRQGLSSPPAPKQGHAVGGGVVSPHLTSPQAAPQGSRAPAAPLRAVLRCSGVPALVPPQVPKASGDVGRGPWGAGAASRQICPPSACRPQKLPLPILEGIWGWRHGGCKLQPQGPSHPSCLGSGDPGHSIPDHVPLCPRRWPWSASPDSSG